MITKNIINTLYLRSSPKDITAKSINEDKVSQRFENMNHVKHLQFQGVNNFKNNEALFHMIMIRIINSWKIALEGREFPILSDLIINVLTNIYPADKDIIEENIKAISLNHDELIPIYRRNQIQLLFFDTVYESIKFLPKNDNVNPTEFLNMSLYDALENFLEHIIDFNATTVMIEAGKKFDADYNKSSEDLINLNLDDEILLTQNNIITQFLNYENYWDLYYSIQTPNLLFDRIDEIVDTISKIIKRTTSSFSPEFINSTNLYFNGLNSKSIASFGTLNEFLSQFNGVKYSGSIPIGLYDNQGDKELEIKFNSAGAFGDASFSINNPKELEFNYVERFKYLSDFEKMTLKGDISKSFISGFHNVIMKIIGRVNPEIAKNTALYKAMYVRMTSFVENQLIGPLPYDNALNGEFLREYLLFMDGSRLYSNIQKFLDTIATKLIGISNINVVWNIDLLDNLSKELILDLNRYSNSNVFGNQYDSIYNELNSEATRLLSSALGNFVKKVDDEIFHILNIFSINEINNNINVKLKDFSLRVMKLCEPLLTIKYSDFEEKINDISNRSIQLMYSDMFNYAIPTLFFNMLFSKKIAVMSYTNKVINGSFIGCNYKAMEIHDIYSYIFQNNIVRFTNAEFQKIDSDSALKEFLKIGYISSKIVQSKMEYLNFKNSEILIDFTRRRYNLVKNTEYSIKLESVLKEYGFIKDSEAKMIVSNNSKVLDHKTSKDIFNKFKFDNIEFTPINLSRFIETNSALNRYFFNPEIKKYIPKVFLNYLDEMLTENQMILNKERIFGNGSGNILFVNQEPKTLNYKGNCDMFMYGSENVLSLSNSEIATIVPKMVHYFDGSNYLINTLTGNSQFSSKELRAFSNKYLELYQGSERNIPLDFLCNKHRDLRVNYISNMKFNAIYNIFSGNLDNLFDEYKLFETSYESDVKKFISKNSDDKIFKEITLLGVVK